MYRSAARKTKQSRVSILSEGGEVLLLLCILLYITYTYFVLIFYHSRTLLMIARSGACLFASSCTLFYYF